MTRVVSSVLPLTAAVLAGLSHFAYADDKKQDMEVIVVSASGYEQMLKEAPASISVIDREQLEKRFYRDLTDAMTDVPGVVVTGGGDRKDISLRGMASQYTLILIDGQRQTSRETRPNSDGPGVEGAWTPPISAIERIEVIRGPMSSLYGSDAIGGVINIITRKTPEKWYGELRLDSTIQESSESGNINQGSFFTAGGLIPELLGMQLSGQFSKRDEDDFEAGFRGKEQSNIKAKFILTPSDSHEIMLEVGSAKQKLDETLGKTVAPLAEGESCGRNGCPESSTTEYDQESYSLSHNGFYDFGSSRSYLKYDKFDNTSREMYVENTDAQTSWTLPFTNHNAAFGASYLKEELDDYTSNRISDLTHVENEQWSVFAEDEWAATKQFKLTTGLRYDHDGNFSGHFSPRLYGVYTATKSLTVKGGISTGFRAPNIRQSTAAWGQVSRGGNIYGNPDLSPEKSVNYEMGIYYDASRDLSLSSTVFYNEFEDKITRISCPLTQCTDGPNQFGSMPTTYVNVDEAVTQGFELSVSYDITSELDVSANYTYTDSEQKTGEYKGSPLNQLPKHILQTSVNWRPVDKLGTWLRVHYRGEESQPTTGPSQDSLIAPDYTLADIGGNYDLSRSIKLGFGVYNLFDKEITEDEYGYVEDGRRYWLSVGFNF
ncbi:ligand-gated channel protein [Pseudoalteromonas shioyasakiensis]|uniref:Ligand-gated channel protein n=1 Tax=Pseudoalteromonas shioyasakiensis TaxID=1190813 RepID=A0ABT6TZS9_9GAMM|nr:MULTISPECIES: ligand-gated channel protein [Pseudoalteromonas]MDI4668916.1 ligand-gated channel protein [Pseudoalteromonas shioyasakiensis]MDI4674041.1 ligand-gated channel protein [Pseudoalteromonas shioyasakiensis]MDI4685410.1 ligand-gated channel protein [Pseudoalteromonas shioyasakiensis]MDI4704118.1 ligand-gated channel protein [Pseudoalteromonas shioyasakiensis]NUJ21162.1 ligand-gated channel protein [Pseudoalteromonas sp. 0802]